MLNIFNLSLRLNGFPIEEAKKKLTEILEISETDYEQYINHKKKDIVNFHLKNNAFYQDLVGQNASKKWEDLPIMKKKDFQKPLIERLSHGYSIKNVYINKTSGSSGDPMVFAKDKFCHALIWVNIMRRFNWYQMDYNHSLQARFYGMPLEFIPNKILRLKDFLSNRYRMNIFDLSDTGLEKITNHFKNKKFDYINGYTNTIVLLAKYLKKKDIILKEICPTLKVCIATSEMLFEDDKILLENQLGIPIINEYGASELDIIAMQSPNGEFKVNAENLFVEILDEENNILPNGEEGRIVVTNLYNKAHPFIRYEVGDYGVLDEKSTLKNPILKKLIGRTNDVALLPSGKKSPGMTFYSITKKLFGDEGNVKEFIIKQTKLDTFVIEYTSEKPLTTSEIEKMNQVFSSYLEPNLNYIYNRKSILERSKSGKLKQFVSLLQ